MTSLDRLVARSLALKGTHFMRTMNTLRLTSCVLVALVCAAACGADDDDDGDGAGGSAGRAGSSGKGGKGGSSGKGSGGKSGTAGEAGSAGQSGDAGDGGSAGEGGAGAGGEAAAAGESGAGAGGESAGLPGKAGPADSTTDRFKPPLGTAADGRDIFRFETFGNEGFWTGVLQLPQGVVAAGLTPVQALTAGLSVDIDRVPEAMKPVLAAELETDLSAGNAPALNDPATTVALIEANAVIGLSARNVTELNGMLDIDAENVFAGESVGVTCALCHGITDGSVFSLPNGGSIGKRVDGPTNHNLNVGGSIALGLNSRAYYPTLALDLEANNHMSVSRKGPGVGLISAAATEVEVDAYLTDPELYPVGMFDDAPDGNGAPMHITPMFRADLAAPWGSEGSIEMLQNFSNLVYTALLDPTGLTTAGGRKFLLDRGGAAGTEIADNYEAILASIGIPEGDGGYPFVGRASNTLVTIGLEAGAKVEPSPIGMQVDPDMMADMNAYMNSLPAPAADKSDPLAIARGRNVFRQQCTSCHNDDQSKVVPQNIVPFNASVDLFANAPARPALWPGYEGALLADRTEAGLAPVRNSSGPFDDKLVIVDASNRNQPRGDALPLLMDLARKPSFLHDDSVASLDALLDPSAREPTAPHPFFIADAAQRADVIKFLNSLDDQPLP